MTWPSRLCWTMGAFLAKWSAVTPAVGLPAMRLCPSWTPRLPGRQLSGSQQPTAAVWADYKEECLSAVNKHRKQKTLVWKSRILWGLVSTLGDLTRVHVVYDMGRRWDPLRCGQGFPCADSLAVVDGGSDTFRQSLMTPANRLDVCLQPGAVEGLFKCHQQ